jgi:hypothetical protein
VISQSMKDFIEGALNVDGAASDPPVIKNVAEHSRATFRNDIESGLRELLTTYELTTRDWDEKTGAGFNSEAELYDYLRKMYDYLFRGSEELPVIPD